MPPPRKPKEDRARRNEVATLGLPAVPAGPPPLPPDGLRPSLQADWLEFWRTPWAGLIAPTDHAALRRLYQLRERSARAHEAFIAGGDEALAYGRLATTTDAEIRQLEDKFPMTAAGRLKFVSELDAADRAALAMQERADDVGSEEADDSAPRLADLEDGEDPRPVGGDVDGARARPRRGRPRG